MAPLIFGAMEMHRNTSNWKRLKKSNQQTEILKLFPKTGNRSKHGEKDQIYLEIFQKYYDP